MINSLLGKHFTYIAGFSLVSNKHACNKIHVCTILPEINSSRKFTGAIFLGIDLRERGFFP